VTSRLLWALLALVSGAFLSIQSRMNGELAVVFGHGLDAALWSFLTGTVVLTVALIASRSMRSGLRQLRTALADGGIRWYQCVGGFMGGLFVFCQSYAVPLAGVALWTVAVVGGQTTSGMAVDRFGIGPAGRLPVNAGRAVAAGLATVGVIVAVEGRISATEAIVVLPVVLSVFAGVSLAVQAGINGRVGTASGNAFTTAWLNFTLGSVILLVLAVPEGLLGQFGAPKSVDAPWWAWWGGLLGIVVIAAGAVGVRYLGVLLQLLLMLVGQLSVAALLDVLNPATRGTVTPIVLVGLLLTLVAAGLAGISARRAQRRRPAAEERSGRAPAAWQDRAS
jgi:transporter family-2 protein